MFYRLVEVLCRIDFRGSLRIVCNVANFIPAVQVISETVVTAARPAHVNVIPFLRAIIDSRSLILAYVVAAFYVWGARELASLSCIARVQLST